MINNLVKKLNDKKSDEVKLTFFFDINNPHYIFIKKQTSSTPTIEYFQSHINDKKIQDAGIIFDPEFFHVIEFYVILNKKIHYDKSNISI